MKSCIKRAIRSLDRPCFLAAEAETLHEWVLRFPPIRRSFNSHQSARFDTHQPCAELLEKTTRQRLDRTSKHKNRTLRIMAQNSRDLVGTDVFLEMRTAPNACFDPSLQDKELTLYLAFRVSGSLQVHSSGFAKIVTVSRPARLAVAQVPSEMVWHPHSRSRVCGTGGWNVNVSYSNRRDSLPAFRAAPTDGSATRPESLKPD